jgi:hypothetical protein
VGLWGNFGPLEGVLCKFLYPNFGEFLFHTLQ